VTSLREVARIAGQFERACTGDPWYGPAVKSILAGIDATRLGARVGDTREPGSARA
jgi:hypothetical protein